MSRKILIIDDDPAYLEITSTTLSDAFPDLVIHGAKDGFIGDQKLRENDYDLILLDYRLPFEMNGLRFLEISQDRRKGIPTVMITAEGNEKIAAKAFRMGATDYLIKTERTMIRIIELIKEVFKNHPSTIEKEKPVKAQLSKADSGIELIRQYQKELNQLDAKTALRGEVMLMEFDQVGEFNKFTRLIKYLRGVKIKDTKILEKKYVLLLSLMPSHFQRIRAVTNR